MTDVYTHIRGADRATQERLSAILELRAGPISNSAIVDEYLGNLKIGPAARASRRRVRNRICDTCPRQVAGHL